MLEIVDTEVALAGKLNITMTVHRAILEDSFPHTSLAALLAAMRANLEPGQHIVDRGLFNRAAVKFPSFPKTNDAVAMLVGLYEVGAERSTIKPTSPIESYETSSLSAPPDAEFLDQQVAVLVSDNFLVSCGLGSRLSSLLDAIVLLADRCGEKVPHASIAFTNAPNKLTVEKIRKVGVKYIKFDVADYLGSLKIPSDSAFGEVFGASSGHKDYERNEMLAEVVVQNKRIGRAKMDFEVVERAVWLDRAAERVLDEDTVQSYVIILNDASEWKQGDLKLTKSVSVSREGSSYKEGEVLQQMLEYLKQLEEQGHLR